LSLTQAWFHHKPSYSTLVILETVSKLLSNRKR